MQVVEIDAVIQRCLGPEVGLKEIKHRRSERPQVSLRISRHHR